VKVIGTFTQDLDNFVARSGAPVRRHIGITDRVLEPPRSSRAPPGAEAERRRKDPRPRALRSAGTPRRIHPKRPSHQVSQTNVAAATVVGETKVAGWVAPPPVNLAAKTGAEAPNCEGLVLIATGVDALAKLGGTELVSPREKYTNPPGAFACVMSTGVPKVNLYAVFTLNGVEPDTFVDCVPSAAGVAVPLNNCALAFVTVPAAAPQRMVAALMTTPVSTGTATALATALTPPAAESMTVKPYQSALENALMFDWVALESWPVMAYMGSDSGW